MRSTAAVAAGLVAVVAAGDWTTTSTVDVTVTSCSPTHTNCPYKPVDAAATSVVWEDWSSTSVEPVKPTDWASSVEDPAQPTTWADWSETSTVDPAEPSTWADWSETSTVDDSAATTTWADWSSSTPAAPATTSSCPAYTASGPPAWFSYLPSSVLSSIEAKWTGAPPADWCYYTYSTAAWSTAAGPTGASSAWGAGATSAAAGWGATTTGPVLPTWTGAANANTGSLVVAGLAAVAALVMV